MRAFAPVAAVLVSGLALYFTRSVLDVVVVDGRPVRVALLPGWPVLAAFIAMATLGVLWLVRRSLPRTVTSVPIRLRVGALTLPLFALALLVVPYLPILPDIVRPLVLAAGPLKWVIWLAVAGLLLWALWQGRLAHADWLARLTVVQAAALIGVATALVVRTATGFTALDTRDAIALVSAAIAAALMWKCLVDSTNSPGASTFAWAAATMTVPFVMTARDPVQMVTALAIVIAFAYAPDGPGLGWRLARWIAIVVPPLTAAWLDVSNRGGDIAFRNLIVGTPALLFDQQYGLLAYAPVYILAATGLVLMIRSGDVLRRRAIEIIGVFLVVLTGGALGSLSSIALAVPARPLASVCVLLALPIAFAARAASIGSVQRASHQLLFWLSLGVALMTISARDSFVGTYEPEGASRLLEYWSSAWPAWTAAPSFMVEPMSSAWIRSGVWLVTAALTAVVLWRWRTRTAGGATLVAAGGLTAALLVASAIASQFDTVHLVPVNLNARAHLSLLDGFDRETRPYAIKYDRFQLLPAQAVVPLASLSVAPRSRADTQPIRVLHNGRFSLPAGQYRVDVEWAEDMPESTPLSIQVGMVEPPWQTWTVQPQRGTHWTVDITLPVDTPFIALRAGTDVERAIGNVVIQPTAVVDASARPHVPAIQTASQMGSAMVLYHDEGASQESDGFWVLGGQTARVSFARNAHDGPLTLLLHSGLKPNRVRLSSRGWQETLYLNPRVPQQITVPDSERRVVTVDVRAEDGFRPRDYDPASPDPRFLGAWVEIAPANH